MSIREAYEASLRRHGHEEDPAQLEVVDRLDTLRQRISSGRPGLGLIRWFRRGARRNEPATKGLYIWGGVGRGKTFMMDLFFDALDAKDKQRIHFHRLMRDVHRRLKSLGDVEDPLDKVAAAIARETRVLCFDEFFVSDIGDAMILGRLLDGLFRRGIILVTTSNAHPDDLYKNGLQRQRFLPAIQSLHENMEVVKIGGNIDYRLRLLRQAGTYITPADASAQERLQQLFDESASSQIIRDTTLDVNGRDIRVEQCAKGIAWFDFGDLCDGPRSQNDYIEIARWYPTVIVSGVPILETRLEDQARRFMALIDEFYDRRVKVILSAAAPAESLYAGSKLRAEFDRTVSRLIEMQSTDYLAAPHLA